MTKFFGHAPGKAILFGEHAVVYGHPALAVPLPSLQASATVYPLESPPSRVTAEQIALDQAIAGIPVGDPLRIVIEALLAKTDTERIPPFHLSIHSGIPIASGLGSGAAVSVAVIRALAGFLALPLSATEVNALAFEAEKVHHGTPSGIDNTVITTGKPVAFRKGAPLEILDLPAPFWLVIADSGIPAHTKVAVAAVRARYEDDPQRTGATLETIGNLTLTAKAHLLGGQSPLLGPLMNENHSHLRALGVSHPRLDALCAAALDAGAMGAKLSGGGQGGNIIALAEETDLPRIANALTEAGAAAVYTSKVE